jgi:hypothetical protein
MLFISYFLINLVISFNENDYDFSGLVVETYYYVGNFDYQGEFFYVIFNFRKVLIKKIGFKF